MLSAGDDPHPVQSLLAGSLSLPSYRDELVAFIRSSGWFALISK